MTTDTHCGILAASLATGRIRTPGGVLASCFALEVGFTGVPAKAFTAGRFHQDACDVGETAVGLDRGP